MELLKTPKEDIARDEVVLLQEAQTKIKEMIAQDVTNGVPKAETEKKIQALIDEFVNETTLDKMAIRSSLLVLAKNGYWITSRNFRILKERFANEMKQVEPSYILGQGLNPTQEAEKFRPYRDTNPKGLAVIESYQKRVKSVMNDLASEPARVVMNKNGKLINYSIRNFAEMTVRYQANMEDLERLKDSENDLVWTSQHADCSTRCQTWQNRLYSISGKTGKIDGITYTPLAEAMAGKDGTGNGIITGYNCRHRLIPYQRGTRPQREFDSAFIRKQRAVDQRQRQYENDIRNLKTKERLARSTGDTEEAQRLNNRWKSNLEKYKAYSFRNGRAYYEWRTQINRVEAR